MRRSFSSLSIELLLLTASFEFSDGFSGRAHFRNNQASSRTRTSSPLEPFHLSMVSSSSSSQTVSTLDGEDESAMGTQQLQTPMDPNGINANGAVPTTDAPLGSSIPSLLGDEEALAPSQSSGNTEDQNVSTNNGAILSTDESVSRTPAIATTPTNGEALTMPAVQSSSTEAGSVEAKEPTPQDVSDVKAESSPESVPVDASHFALGEPEKNIAEVAPASVEPQSKPFRVTRVEASNGTDAWTTRMVAGGDVESVTNSVANQDNSADGPDFIKTAFELAGKFGDFVKHAIDDARNPEILQVPDPGFNVTGMTERIMNRMPTETQAGGAGGQSTYQAFKAADENWSRLKNLDPDNLPEFLKKDFVFVDGGAGNPQAWVKLNEQKGKKLDYDVVICGGTLGIFFATALQLRGLDICVVEAGKMRGREQEWNISMDELLELVELGVLTKEDIDAAVQTEFPACRSGFKNKEVTPVTGGYFDNGVGFETATEDVLNLGVSPTVLIERTLQRFKEAGGTVRDETRLNAIHVSPTAGAAMDLGDDQEPITARLVMDCMGNGSPVTRQQRRGTRPDGVCAVVGSCADGFEPRTNMIGDIIYTNQGIIDKKQHGNYQYFWEAFPVGIGRGGMEPGTSNTKTTYMFTYMDADKKRVSLESLMDDYWSLLPTYQPSIKNPETDLDFRRVLFAYFPTYRASPLKPAWDRVIAVGDASGIQSPLSFGGFGALTRHLGRITDAVTEALELDLTTKEDLGEINAYTPNLSAAWMFQKAMSVRVGQKVNPEFVNRLLAVNFEEMDKMGLRTMKPFLQDVVRFDGLIGSLARSFKADPTFMPEIVAHVGLPTLANWLLHVGNMGLYSFLDSAVSPLFGPVMESVLKEDKDKFKWRRRMEAWKYGSGNDYKLDHLPR